MNFKIFYFVLVSFLISLFSIAEEFEIDQSVVSRINTRTRGYRFLNEGMSP